MRNRAVGPAQKPLGTTFILRRVLGWPEGGGLWLFSVEPLFSVELLWSLAWSQVGIRRTNFEVIDKSTTRPAR